ncbi:TetR/AcrR family transcriptional regulator, partial [Mesorhizobium sp. CN2-181]|uniref:TetR/AcrR family transcriptional regulator n=1 Tax=Mesorhizobium yinganensis TaxID=3157707 RepID=UPI0032B7BCD1
HDKNELAREMVRRFIDENNALFDDLFGRGKQLSDDPLQAFMIGLKLLAETLAEVKAKHPGCLIASICYQERLFDREVVEMIRKVTIDWNARFQGYLEEIAEVYPIRNGIELSDMADALCCIVDGGILMAKILGDSSKLERQVMTYRNFVRLAFSPAVPVVLPLRVASAA